MTAYADIDAVNWSLLKHLAVSAKMLRHRVDHPKEDTKALALGRAIHCAVLEPERWRAEYIAEPDEWDLRTNRGKAERAQWLAEMSGNEVVARPYFDRRRKAGKDAAKEWERTVAETGSRAVIGDEPAEQILGPEITVLTRSEYALAERCAEAVLDHPVASGWLSEIRTEEVITWTDSETGLRCKGRLDSVSPTFVLDLKSTRRETLREIFADVARHLYHGQLAFYADGAIASGAVSRIGAQPPRMITVQTSPPHDVAPLVLPVDHLQTGRMLYRDLLRRYAQHVEHDLWPGIAPGPVEIELPRWALGGEPPEEAAEEGADW